MVWWNCITTWLNHTRAEVWGLEGRKEMEHHVFSLPFATGPSECQPRKLTALIPPSVEITPVQPGPPSLYSGPTRTEF